MNRALMARAGAIAIAIAAAIDPALTRDRPVPIPVAIVHDGQSSALASRIGRELGDRFAISAAPAPDIQATVMIGTPGLPLPAAPETGRVFVIDDPSRAATLMIRALDLPHTALVGHAVTAVARVAGAQQGTTFALFADGRLVARGDEPALRFTPARAGLVPLRLEVTSGSTAAHADSVLLVEARKLRVHFVDPLPSWSSTFVRRALEQDAAFDVSSDTATSRGVASTAGASLRYDDRSQREDLDVIVAGAPSALSASARRALEAFARERGGAVILLADESAANVLQQFTGTSWNSRRFDAPVQTSAPHGGFMLSEALLPSTVPPSAAVIAAAGTGNAPVIVEVPAGHGRLIASGALDAWRYRARPESAFAAFWRGVISDAALAAAAPLSLSLSLQRVNPSDEVEIEAVIRNADREAWVEGTLESGGASIPVRFWPAASPGVFTARITAPLVEGRSIVTVRGGTAAQEYGAQASLEVIATAPFADRPDSAAALLASTRGGAHIAGGDIAALRAALDAAIPAHHAPVTTHPMRYAWWLAPFTLLLGYEWRWRRQRGLK